MKKLRIAVFLTVLAPLVAVARDPGEPDRAPQLLAKAKAQAIQLREDAAAMESFSRAPFLCPAEPIKGHVEEAGRLVARLARAADHAESWQASAMVRVIPLLKELAANTRTAIEYVDENRQAVYTMEFAEFVSANYDESKTLAKKIGDLVDHASFMDQFQQFDFRNQFEFPTGF
jgi:hypothetical protein